MSRSYLTNSFVILVGAKRNEESLPRFKKSYAIHIKAAHSIYRVLSNILLLFCFATALLACNAHKIPGTKNIKQNVAAKITVDDNSFVPGADVINRLKCTVANANTLSLKNFILYAKGEGQRTEMYLYLPDSISNFEVPLHLLLEVPKTPSPAYLWDWEAHAQPPLSPAYLNDSTFVNSIEFGFSIVQGKDTLRSNMLKVKIKKN